MSSQIKIPTKESDIVELKTISDNNLPKNIWEQISAFSNGEYRDLNNMTEVGDDRKAKRELVRMVDLDLLKKAGARRNRKYISSGTV
ncbi:MAG: hypothetical protein ABIJ43_03625 [Candidatus Beckwithbacteria bacterium]|nr:hypothetical protein [Patescibacteria group bacterium]